MLISSLWHTADKPARFLVLGQRQANADMTALAPRAGEVLGDLIEMNVAMGEIKQKLRRT